MTSQLSSISDDALLDSLSEILQRSRRIEAELVAHIGEMDRRRLYAREAAPSMFAYCTNVLHLSEGEAYLRIAVARAARTHPVLLSMLADGRLHLSGIKLLAPHLTKGNRDTLLSRAMHKSRRRIEQMVAEIAPRPDAPATIRKLPAVSRKHTEAVASPPQTPSLRAADTPADQGDGGSPAPAPGAAPLGDQSGAPASAARQPGRRRERLWSDDTLTELVPEPVETAPVPARPVVEPLAPTRYKVTFTAGVELRDKIQRLQALMRSSVPDGDLAAIIDVAVTEKLERLEARRFGKTKAPRKTVAQADALPHSRDIPAPVRRAVYERDGGRCTFADRHRRRCPERDHLEFHHAIPFALGGDHSVTNIRLCCAAHNRYLAELDYGKAKMEQYGRAARAAPRPAVAAAPATRRANPKPTGEPEADGRLPGKPCGVRWCAADGYSSEPAR